MKKKILVTGSKGFIAKNFISHLEYGGFSEFDVIKVCRSTSDQKLKQYVESADILIHLAGENRPKSREGFIEGNFNYTQKLVDYSKKNKTPIIYTSSIQAELNNDYGLSKLAAEETLLNYQKETGAIIAISRLPNVFGKWCKPNYNSFIATMCYNLWRDIPLNIKNENQILNLVYVDDVIKTLIEKMNEIIMNGKIGSNYFSINPQYKETIKNIFNFLNDIKDGQRNLKISNRSDGFNRALSATFLSYCPEKHIKYTLEEYADERGSFYEIFKLGKSGQISVSTTKPGIVRGNHFHHSKQEKFLVIKGKCAFKFRCIDSGNIVELQTSEDKKEVVEVPLGYTHNFTNIGTDELVVLIWCNEEFDRKNPDTYFLEV
ncbi:capsular biosynthesis protein [Paraphotobacterium marinum]|uniref:Capsular biosynthesis protein n=1 Tax=Paraphotobacterium marinum TaxID=1755811 RepID=A0A220VCN8_9GAMM|nr:NAD-dependent epimerase/dehydratase family protein [Paraphotobacterium marinum]ASK78105.1 capsular biosynthesis protein [Paraphotobacterium marinum]